MGLSFTDPLFERLDLEELEIHLGQITHKTRSSVEELVYLQLHLFLVEAADHRGKIHKSRNYWEQLETLCREHEDGEFKRFEASEKVLAIYSCAIGMSWQVNREVVLTREKRVARVHRLLRLAADEKPDPGDRFYAEARIFYALPISVGQRIGKSLLALHFLKRLTPNASSIYFWLGRVYELQGNEKAAKEAYEQALSHDPPDGRAKLFFPAGVYRRDPRRLDGEGFGIAPGLFFNPTTGFGLSMFIDDDRVGDADRKFAAVLTAATEGHFEIGARIEDHESLADGALILDGQLLQGAEEFFGLGMTSAKGGLSELTTQRAELALSHRQYFWDFFYFELGWALNYMRLKEALGGVYRTTPLVDPDNSFHTGPFFEIVFESRDSKRAPRRGNWASLSGYFPHTVLGSERTFERWHLNWHSYFQRGLKHTIGLYVTNGFMRDPAPYAALLKLGRWIPGIRLGRFQDRAILGTAVEYQYALWKGLSLYVFGNMGRVASDWDGLFEGPMRFGAGGGGVFRTNRYHSPELRLELSVFASEFLLRVAGGVRFF